MLIERNGGELAGLDLGAVQPEQGLQAETSPRVAALLLLDLSRRGADALAEYMRRELGADKRPGIVVCFATAGDLLQWHVHLHVLATAGAFSSEGTFHSVATWDAEALMQLFRERLLARLVENHAISQGAGQQAHGLERPDFSAHVGEPIKVEDTQALETVAGYVTRNPLSLQRARLPRRPAGGHLQGDQTQCRK